MEEVEQQLKQTTCDNDGNKSQLVPDQPKLNDRARVCEPLTVEQNGQAEGLVCQDTARDGKTSSPHGILRKRTVSQRVEESPGDCFQVAVAEGTQA